MGCSSSRQEVKSEDFGGTKEIYLSAEFGR